MWLPSLPRARVTFSSFRVQFSKHKWARNADDCELEPLGQKKIANDSQVERFFLA